MKSDFSKTWVASKQTRKQRKYRFNAPFHIRSKFLNVNLSKDLRKKYGIRNIRVRKGDKIKVLRGSHRKQIAKVEKISVTNTKVFLEKIEQVKKDGNKTLKPFEPSNLQIVDLDVSDKKRIKKLKTSKDASKDVPKKLKSSTSKPSQKDAVVDTKQKITKGNSNGKKSS